MRKVPRAIHLGLYADETSALCRWHLPEAHEFESWGDARAFDGTVSLLQPLIAPLYGGIASSELLASLLEDAGRSGYDIVRDYWRGQKLGGDDFEAAWETALHDGLIAGTALAPKQVTLKPGAVRGGSGRAGASNPALEISFRPDPTIWDGRFANNGWLQELPKPMTKLTWDNAALVSPRTAEALGLDNEDLVELRYRGRSVRGPGLDHARARRRLRDGEPRLRPDAGGTGRATAPGSTPTPCGPPTPPASAPAWRSARRAGSTRSPAPSSTAASRDGTCTGSATLEQYQADHHFAHEGHAEPEPDMSLYPQWSYEGNAWGMVVNLNACVGCNACVVACQAENNIPVVGKEEVLRGREMHWLEIDRYFSGDDLDDPETYLQPRLCMHCENAPCEVVCPVAATTHSAEGLNEMTYNRCVGTRYCQNNCPYKVRHFNFFEYSAPRAPVLTVLNNPDVTVRSRGVMEKCTYCVQRINAGRIQADAGGPGDPRRRGRDGLPGGLPDPGDRLRQHQRSRERGGQAQAGTLELRDAGRAEHPAPHHLSGALSGTPTPSSNRSRAMSSTRPEGDGAGGVSRAGPRAGAHAGLGHRQDQLARPGPPVQLSLDHRLRRGLRAADAPADRDRQPAATTGWGSGGSTGR